MREDMPLLGRWVAHVFQRYWRVARGLILSVEACVVNEQGRLLMVRDESGGSWEMPKGRVLKSENLEAALRRVARDVAGIEVNGKAELAFFHATSGNEQTGLYVVRDWRPAAGAVQPKMSFISAAELSAITTPKLAERIRRLLQDRTPSEV